MWQGSRIFLPVLSVDLYFSKVKKDIRTGQEKRTFTLTSTREAADQPEETVHSTPMILS